MDRIKAVITKEFLHIIRDPRTLMLIIFMPLMQLIIYGYAINTDVKHMRTALYDEDRTPFSRRLVQSFEQSSYFNITEHVDSMKALRHAVDKGDALAGLHIPPRFTADLLAGKEAPLQMVIDGTDSNPANTALNTSQSIVLRFMEKEHLIPVQVMPIDYRPRLWYNPDLKSTYFMVPGLIGLLLQLLIPMITATSVVREKERGNIEQLLVTPIKPYELIIGKLIPYIGIAFIMATTILGGARFLFHVPIRGNIVTLYGLTLIFITACLGLGLFASTVANTQQQAAQIVMFFAAPSILLSGFIFPREGMPWPIYYLGNIIPLTYFLKIVRGIVLKGLGIADLWGEIIPLLIIAVVIMFLSIKKFHKRLS